MKARGRATANRPPHGRKRGPPPLTATRQTDERQKHSVGPNCARFSVSREAVDWSRLQWTAYQYASWTYCRQSGLSCKRQAPWTTSVMTSHTPGSVDGTSPLWPCRRPLLSAPATTVGHDTRTSDFYQFLDVAFCTRGPRIFSETYRVGE